MSSDGQPRRWAASAQLAEELDELRRKFSELEVQLKDELRLRDRLLQEEKANDQQALNLEKKMAEIRSKHLVDVAKLTAQTRVLKEQEEAKLKRFAAIRDELRITLEPFDHVLMENNRLHENLQVLLHDLANEAKVRDAHTATVKQRNFHTRLKLEATYRRTVEELTLRYQRLAREKMQAESDAAIVQNMLLRESLSKRSNDVMHAMKKHLQAASMLHHTRVEHSLLETASNLGREKVRGLQGVVANQETAMQSYKDSIEEAQRRIEELSIEQREVDHLVDEVLSLETQCHQATERCQRLRETALHKAKTVVYDAKNLDAGVVAIMGEEHPSAQSTDCDTSTASTTDSHATRSLSIDLIWQANHATDLFQPHTGKSALST